MYLRRLSMRSSPTRRSFAASMRVAAFVAAALLAGPSDATTITTTDPAVFAEFSEGAVEGTVLSSTTRTIAGRLMTVAEMRIERGWGALSAERTVEVVAPGGRSGEWTTVVPGAPALPPGTRVFAFVASTPTGWQPVAMGWSVYDATGSPDAPAPSQQASDDVRALTLAELRELADVRFGRPLPTPVAPTDPVLTP